MSENLTTKQALVALSNGEKITHETWSPGSYIFLDDQGMIRTDRNELAEVNPANFPKSTSGNGWKIYKQTFDDIEVGDIYDIEPHSCLRKYDCEIIFKNEDLFVAKSQKINGLKFMIYSGDGFHAYNFKYVNLVLTKKINHGKVNIEHKSELHLI